MKNTWIIVFAGLSVVALIPGACGGGGSGGNGGSGGHTTTTTTTTTTTATGGTGAGGASSCSGVTLEIIDYYNPYGNEQCTPCLDASCCSVIAACEAFNTSEGFPCYDCYAFQGDSCDDPAVKAAADAVTACVAASCQTQCEKEALPCNGFLAPGACETCLESSCCVENTACGANQDCIDCITGDYDDVTVCLSSPTKELYDALFGCAQTKCNVECFAQCNPVTNDGCDSSVNDACDQDPDTGEYVCWEGDNTVPLCGACDYEDGPWCAPGMRCFEGTSGSSCARYCCVDSDCGPGGTCYTWMLTGGVGLCLGPVPPDGSAPPPVCDAPAVSPSSGSCFSPAQPDAGT